MQIAIRINHALECTIKSTRVHTRMDEQLDAVERNKTLVRTLPLMFFCGYICGAINLYLSLSSGVLMAIATSAIVLACLLLVQFAFFYMSVYLIKSEQRASRPLMVVFLSVYTGGYLCGMTNTFIAFDFGIAMAIGMVAVVLSFMISCGVAYFFAGRSDKVSLNTTQCAYAPIPTKDISEEE